MPSITHPDMALSKDSSFDARLRLVQYVKVNGIRPAAGHFACSRHSGRIPAIPTARRESVDAHSAASVLRGALIVA